MQKRRTSLSAHLERFRFSPKTHDITPALYTKISVEEFPQWVQPTGAQDAYKKGDKVTYDNKHWISTADNNVWQPGVYGWDEVNE